MAIPDDYDPLADFLPPRITPAAPPAPPVPLTPPVQASPMPLPEPDPDDAPTLLNPQTIPPAAAPVIPAPAPAAPVPAHVPAPAPASLSRAPGAQAADDPVIQALMRGLGLTELGGKRSAEEVAELAGAMLREATAGTMGVLMARAMTKRESRLEMTMISSQANNPLKFFPDADSALMQMMNASMPGYMQPVKAYANAFDDLKAHELAIMAGMRAALNGVLKRFDPTVIEQRLQVPTVMDKMLSSNRKAKMWDRMVELYQQMALEADEDFQRLFGETFGDAYEEQIARLQQGRR
jgi:type VI secretion system FHA domain protein